MLTHVLATIDIAKKGTGIDYQIRDSLNNFIQWAGNNKDHGIPKELVDSVVDFRETWVRRENSLERLGLPEEVKGPLRTAFRLRDEWRMSGPGERPSPPPSERPQHPGDRQFEDYDPEALTHHYKIQDYESWPGLVESYPQRLQEWQEKEDRHNELGRLYRDQLKNIPDNNDIPDWLLDDLR